MTQLSHSAFLASLPAETRGQLTELSDRPGLVHLALHLGAIVCLAAWVAIGAALWPLALWPLGILIAFLFTLQHECTHKTPFRTPWLNDAVGFVTGVILIQPFHWFRAFHMAHHRFTNDPERDPELATPKPQTTLALMRYLSGVDYWFGKAQVLLQNASGRADGDYISPRQRGRITREAWAMLATYGLLWLAFGSLLFWVWLLPFALGIPVLRLYLLAEHARCPSVANMFENTRTTLTTRAIRWLAWNMPYHAEHHAWPQVPFHKLPDVHALAEPHLQSVSDGYGPFTRSYVGHLNQTAGQRP